MSLNPTPPNTVGINIRATVKTQSRGGNFLTAHILGTDCGISLDTTRNPPTDLGIVGNFVLQAPADPITDLTSVNVTIDTQEFFIDNLPKLMGILRAIVEQG